MKALTLIQPWAWCITHAGKRVENRTWAPPASLLGQRFAIHAGKAPRIAEAERDLAEHGVYVHPPDVVFGAVVATVRLVGVAKGHGSSWFQVSGTFERNRPLIGVRDGLWFSGPVGWVLDDVRVLSEPVPCRGAQGLWTLPSDVEWIVLAREAVASIEAAIGPIETMEGRR